MDYRLTKVEAAVERVDKTLADIRVDVGEVKGRLASLPSAKDFGELKGRVDSLPTMAKLNAVAAVIVAALTVVIRWKEILDFLRP
jgi:hypothetical protein